MGKFCFTKSLPAVGIKAGSIKELNEDEVKLFKDHVIELDDDAELTDDSPESEDEPGAEKALAAKSRELSAKMEKGLRQKARRQGLEDITAPSHSAVVTSVEPVHKSGGHWLMDLYQATIEDDYQAKERISKARGIYRTQDGRYQVKKTADGVASNVSGAVSEFIPQYWVDNIYEKPIVGLDLASMCTQIPCEGQQTTHIPVDDTTDPNSNGPLAAYTSEAGNLNISNLKSAEVQLTMNALTCLQVGTDQTFRFAVKNPGVLNFMITKAKKARLFKRNQKLVRGNGSGEPQGVINSGGAVTINRDTAATIKWVDVRHMLRHMTEEDTEGYAFFTNNSCIDTLYGMKDDNNNGIFLPAGVNLYPNLANKPQGTLYGFPLYVTQHASGIGNVGDLMLVNWNSSYAFGVAGESQDESIHVYFVKNERAIRFVEYNDAKSLWKNPILSDQGSINLSPQIILGTYTASSPAYFDGATDDFVQVSTRESRKENSAKLAV